MGFSFLNWYPGLISLILVKFFFFFLPRSTYVDTIKAAVGDQQSPTWQPQSYDAGGRWSLYRVSQQLVGSHALTWGEPPGEKPWLETGEVGDWLAEDPTLLRYCWREEAWCKRICLSYSQWRIISVCVYVLMLDMYPCFLCYSLPEGYIFSQHQLSRR